MFNLSRVCPHENSTYIGMLLMLYVAHSAKSVYTEIHRFVASFQSKALVQTVKQELFHILKTANNVLAI